MASAQLSLLPRLLAQSIPTAANSSSILQYGSTRLARWLPIGIPAAIHLQLPTLGSIWDAVLRAVPKKKTSHSKKRKRFLANNTLKDVTELNKCSACGNIKKAHLLCPYCVREIKDMWLGRGTKEAEAARREEKS